MTSEEVLKKAIQKSIDNGWSGWNIQNCSIYFIHDGEQGGLCVVIDHTYTDPMRMDEGRKGNVYHIQAKELIFSHDFAKAFFGEEFDNKEGIDLSPYVSGWEWDFEGKRWQYHLMKMVLEEDPIKYLEQFL